VNAVKDGTLFQCFALISVLTLDHVCQLTPTL